MSDEEAKRKTYEDLRTYCIEHKYTKKQILAAFNLFYMFADFYSKVADSLSLEDALLKFKEGYEHAKNT